MPPALSLWNCEYCEISHLRSSAFSTRVLRQAAVARALLIVLTQIANSISAKRTAICWSIDTRFATAHFADTVARVCFRQRRRVGPKRRLPVVAEDKGKPHGQDPLRAIKCFGPFRWRVQTRAERGSEFQRTETRKVRDERILRNDAIGKVDDLHKSLFLVIEQPHAG